jgi:hypothetical protein
MWILIASIFGVLVLAIAAIATFTLLRYRGAHFVKCPDNQKIQAVTVDAKQAAFAAAIGNPHLQLCECTRWPEMKACGQSCLKQIEYAPQDCLVRNVVARWYEGRRCAVCGDVFHVVHWHDHVPALLDTGGRTVQWSEVPLAKLTEYLDTHEPVCWNCHIVETFRREHGDLITYRKER